MAVGPIDAAFNPGGDIDPANNSTLSIVDLTPEQKAELQGGMKDPAEPAPGGTQEAANGSTQPSEPAPLHPVAEGVARQWLAAGYTPEQTAGALGVIGGVEAPGFNPRAQNPNSGAWGLYQHLGPRQRALQAHLNQTGAEAGDPTAQTDFALRELQGPEAGADRAIRGAKTPEQAALAYTTKFMRPGAVGSTSGYQGPAATMARQVLPGVQKLAASMQPQQQPDQPAEEDWSGLASKIGVHPAQNPTQAPQAAGAPQAPQNIGATPVASQPPGEDDWSGVAQKQQKIAATNPVTAYGPAMNTGPQALGMPPPSPQHTSAWQDVKDWFTMAPNQMVRGLMQKLGFLPDMANAASDWYAQHPMAGTTLGDMPSMPPPGGPIENPNAVGPHIPINSRTLINAMQAPWFGEPGLDLRTPAEKGDMRPGINTGATVMQAIGAGGSPTGVVGRLGTAQTGKIAKLLGDKGARAASVTGHDLLAPGLGGEMASTASEIVGDRGGSPAAQEAAALAAGSVLGLRGGAIALTQKGLGQLGPYQRYVANKVLRGQMGPEGVVSRMADNPEAAGYNLDYGPTGPLPAGFEVPAATASMDAPLQGAFQHIVHNDRIANGDYREVLKNNTAAIDLGRPAGDPASVEAHLQQLRDDMAELTQNRLAQARDDADKSYKAATTDSGGQQLLIGGPGQQYLASKSDHVVKEVHAARDDASALADDQWDVARQGGFTTARAPTTEGYDRIEAMMGRSIARHEKTEDFPWADFAPLYKRGFDPRTRLFDEYGNRLPGTARTGMGNHDGAILGPTATLEELHQVYSNLQASARAERSAILTPGSSAGNPRRLASLNEASNTIRQQIERGALMNGNQASLRAALDATRNLHETFDSGVLGKILNRDAEGAPVVSPEAALRTYLANGERGIANARAIMDATSQRTGMAAQKAAQMPGSFDPQSVEARTQALAAGQAGPPPEHPAVTMQNQISDWLRQDFMNAFHDHGQAGGQKWLDNHSEFFQATHATNGSPFPKLKGELEGMLNDQQAATNLNPQVPGSPAAKSLDATQQSASSLFLGGNPGGAIDRVLRAGDPYTKMNELIGDVKKDQTGHAFNGLMTRMFDRTLAEGKIFDDTVGHYYSGRAMSKFREDNAGAFRALKEADPIAYGNMSKMLNAADYTDRIMSRPQIPGLKDAASPVNMSTIGRMFAQIGAAKLASKGSPLHGLLHAGPMQGPALLSNMAGKAYDHAIQGTTMETASAIMRDAMFDKNKLQALLMPANTPEAKQQVYHQILEPYLQSAAVMGAQPFLNPSPQPNSAPNVQAIGGVPQGQSQ